MRLKEFGQLDEIKKGQKDSNGFSSCWTGYHASGTKKGKNGGRVRNCVKNEGAGAQRAAIAIAKKESGKYSKTTGKRLKEGWQDDIVRAGQATRQAVDSAVKSIPRPFDEKEVANDLRKGTGDKSRQVREMPASLRNDPEGHTIIPHGGMGSGKEETWVHTSIRKLQECIDMIKSGNYTGAEHVLYKGGFLEGAVKALARYEEFKHKQGKRPLAKGREVDLG
jgi:hypothetical protein